MLGAEDIVLVTGGTGFTGSVLLRKLCDLGCKVRVIARPSSDRAAFAGLPIKWFSGDVFDKAIIEQACVGVHYVFHVAAAYREAKIADDVYEKVHVDSTKYLVEACLRGDSLKRFIHVSTVGVLGHIDNPPVDEMAAYNPGDIYQRTKTDAEKWILDCAQRTHLPLTIIRPAAIYGPGDRRLLKLYKMAMLSIVPIIGHTKGLYHLIHVEDLTAFMILAADHPNTLGQTYICGNPEPISIKDMLATIADHFGHSVKFIRIPAWPIFLLADICEWVCKPFGVEPPIYRRRIAFFTKDRAFITDKMRRDTGFQYRYSNAEGIRATGDWYKANAWL